MYDIQNKKGKITKQMPIDGTWYVRMVMHNGYGEPGSVGCCYISEAGIEFVDGNGDAVDMFPDSRPSYLAVEYN